MNTERENKKFYKFSFSFKDKCVINDIVNDGQIPLPKGKTTVIRNNSPESTMELKTPQPSLEKEHQYEMEIVRF